MTKKLFVYGLGIFFSKLIVFLLVPVYTRCFSPADYGYYDVLISNITMVISISFIEIWSGIIRFAFEDKDPFRPIKNFIVLLPILIVIYCFSILILAKIMPLRFPILTFVFGISYLIFMVFNSICRGLNRNVEYVVSGIISTFISCGLGVILVAVLKYGIKSLMVSQIIGYLVSALYVEFKTKAFEKSIGEKVSVIKLKEMVLYCIPLMINSFSFLFLGTYNKNYIMTKLGETASGYYAFVLKFTAILSILISIFSLTWQEVAFQNADNEDRTRMYSYYINVFIKFVGLCLPIYCLTLYFAVPYIGGKTYTDATIYIPLAVSATFISEISGVLSIVIAVNKKTLPILISTIIGALSNVIFLYVVDTTLGIYAASIGLCIGFFLSALYRYMVGRKQVSIHIDIKFLFLIIIEMFLTLYCYYVENTVFIVVFGIIISLIWIVSNKTEILVILSKCIKLLLKSK